MNITEKTIKARVIDFLRQNGINRESSLLAAYSGGPDSGVLLDILADIKEIMGYSLNAVYIDHGIRPQSEMIFECSHIEKYSKSFFPVSVHIRHIPPGKITHEASESGRSVEDLAREYRYRIIEDLKVELGASHVATGHTLDDQIETLIMRFFQGSGIHGLSGIPEVRDGFIRPLISVEKKEILKYLNNNKIPYVTDQTNLSTIYLRNKVRHTLLPVIKEVFPGYRRSLSSFAGKMEAVRSVLEKSVPPLDIRLDGNGDASFSYSEFSEQPVYRQVETIYQSWDLWKNRPCSRLSYKFVTEALKSFKHDPVKIVAGSSSSMLIRDKDRIFWKRVVVVSSKKSYLRVITIGDLTIYPGMVLRVQRKNELDKKFICIREDMVKKPLIVRKKNPGDRIHLSNGVKTLKKLYSEWGVIPEERWKIPVIEDRNGIIAVLGSPYGFSDRMAVKYKNNSSGSDNLIISASLYGDVCE